MIFEAILLGLTLSILLGPVFFALLQTSIKRGFKTGFAFALGIFFSDFSCILLAYAGLSQIITDARYFNYVGWIGGFFLIGLGLFEIFHKEKEEDHFAEAEIQTEHSQNPLLRNIEKKDDNRLKRNFLKAYVLNIITPSVLLFWIFWVGVITSKYGSKPINVIFFFVITLLTVLSTDTLKAYLANQLKEKLNPSFLTWLKKIAGIILVGFGFYLIYKTINGESLMH